MTYLKLFLTAVFWGGTFIAGKGLAGSVDPVNAAFLRFLIASLFLIVITRKMEGKLPKINRRQFPGLVLLGATGVFSYNLFFFNGLEHLHAGRASLIIATNPVFISLFSALFFKEKLGWIKACGIGLSVTGAMVVISNGNLNQIFSHGFGIGELLIFGCVFSWVTYSLIGKLVMGSFSPLVSVCYSSMIGTVLLFFTVLVRGSLGRIPAYGLSDWLNLFYLGFFGTVLGFFWYYDGINKIGPMRAGVFINVVPVSAIIFAYFFLGEVMTPSLYLGALLVVSGVFATNASNMIQTWIDRWS